MYLNYPYDRLTAPLFGGNMAPNLNYRIYNVPAQISQFTPNIAFALATLISQGANLNPIRVYFFNKMSRNNWENDDFRVVLEATCRMVVNGNININDANALYSVADQVIKYFVALDYGTNYSIFSTIVDGNTQNMMLAYIRNNNVQIPGMTFQNQTPAYAQAPGYAPQPAVMPASTYIQNNQVGYPSQSSISALDGDRFSNNVRSNTQETIEMDRRQHQTGVYQESKPNQAPVNNIIIPNNYEDPIVRTTATPLRHSSTEFDAGDELFSSMSDLSNKVFCDNESFFQSTSDEFTYVVVKNFDYVVGAAPFTKVILSLNLIDRFKDFIDEKIDTQEMNTITSKIPGRIKKIFAMFLDEIRLLTNNLMATNNCRTVLTRDRDTTFIDDYRNLELNLISKGREDIVKDLKIALYTWISKIRIFDVKEYTDKTDNASSIMAVVKLNVIVVNVDSRTFSGYSLAELDFLCELRVMILYIITNNNVLFKIEFGSKYDGDKVKYFVPMEMIKLGPLL